MINDHWNNGTDSVHDIRVVNTDTEYYFTKTPERFLQDDTKAKK